MNRLFPRLSVFCLSAFLLTFVAACDDDEPGLPDNVLNFAVASAGMGDAVDEATVIVNLSRATTSDVTVTISFTTEGVTYGEHFTTDPAASGNTLTVTIPAGASAGSFVVMRNADAFLEGDESITFTVETTQGPVVLGTATQFSLAFSAIVSEGAELTLNGIIANEAGTSAGNAVFVDLSANIQTAVARNTWDLGFYNGDDFRVIINNMTAASVVMVDATDLASVTSEDVNVDDLALGLGMGTLDIIDDPEGNIENTAIAAISSNDADNKVYVISRTGGAGAVSDVEALVKVRILRKEDGYILQYALINETEVNTIDIPRSDSHNFEYFSFDNGKVSVEPTKDAWDIYWSWSVFQTGAPGNYIPYAFSDLVFINHLGGTKAAEVLTDSELTYDGFSESDLDGIEWKSDRNVIGSNWRATTPADQAGVRTDRFYLIRDVAGNIYKLKFVSFHPNDGGVRGKPVIQYALVKKADA